MATKKRRGMAALRKAMKNPKTLAKMPPALRAYWAKKNKGK